MIPKLIYQESSLLCILRKKLSWQWNISFLFKGKQYRYLCKWKYINPINKILIYRKGMQYQYPHKWKYKSRLKENNILFCTNEIQFGCTSKPNGILHSSQRGDSNWMEMGQQLGDRNEQQLGNNIWMEIKMSNIWRSNLDGDQHGRWHSDRD